MRVDTLLDKLQDVARPLVDKTNIDQFLAPTYYQLRPFDPEDRELVANIDFPEIDNSTVDQIALFPDLYPGTYRTVFQGLLAHALYQEGIGSIFLYDDKSFPTCKIRDSPKDCAKCTNKSADIADLMGLPTRYITESQTDLYPIAPEAQSHFKQDAIASVKREKRISEVDLNNKEHAALFEQYLTAGKVAWNAVAQLAERRDLDYVITNIGPGLPKRAVFEYAKHHSIDIVGMMDPNFGRGDGYLFNTGERPLTLYMANSMWDQAQKRRLNEDELDRLDTFMSNRFESTKYQEYSKKQVDISSKLDVDPEGTSVYTAVAHLLWDAAIDTRVARTFESHNGWLKETIDWFADRNEVLIIKTHPAEAVRGTADGVAEMIDAEFDTLPSNVTVLSPDTEVNTYELIDFTDIALCYTSTVGIESSYKSTPVVTVGEAHYANRGFTRDAANREEYFEYLDADPASLEMSEEEQRLAKRYTYNFFIERPKYIDCIKPTWDTDDGPFLTLKSYEELLTHEEFSKIAESIRNKDSYFYYRSDLS